MSQSDRALSFLATQGSVTILVDQIELNRRQDLMKNFG
jgi:hypothetical protein